MTSNLEIVPFQTFTLDAIESFLQSVVVLDDLAEMSPSDLTLDSGSDPLTSPDYPQTTQPADSVSEHDPQGVPLHAEQVIAGFADIGSVCAVLSAAPGREFPERTVRAARRADIVVLDWKIQDSVGDAALAVMREILKDDAYADRLRLVAIYTGEPNLGEIHQRVRGATDEFYEEHELVDDPANFRLSKGPLHIVVLAKAGVLTRAPAELGREVSESDLARRLTEEFALMAGGLLRNTAISGIAAVRDNSHKILAKFTRRLDPGYLAHRLLLPHPPDAEDHVEEALGAEIMSVLEDALPGAQANVEAIESWLTSRLSEGLDLSVPFTFPGEQNLVHRWRDLLSEGIGPSAILPEGGRNGLRARGAEAFTEQEAEADRANHRFAALLGLKTRYPGRRPRLTLGTVVQTEGDGDPQYLLCLQPKCDSTRLYDTTGFPLIPLDAAGSGGIEALPLMVDKGVDEWEHFEVNPTPSDLIVRRFEPDTSPPGEVLASAELENGVFCFSDINGVKYRWLAELKDEHALRVATAVANALSRPGPNDSEWLRQAQRSAQ